MPRVEIPLQDPGQNGKIDELTWTAGDAANDHYFDNSSGRVVLLVRNDDTSAKTITVVSVADPYGRTSDHSMSVDATGGGASQVAFVPFLPATAWNQRGAGDLGRVHIDLADATGVSFAAVKVP